MVTKDARLTSTGAINIAEKLSVEEYGQMTACCRDVRVTAATSIEYTAVGTKGLTSRIGFKSLGSSSKESNETLALVHMQT
jgi:hypothetical protein